MGSSVQARRGRSPEAAGFTLLAILVVLAALTLVVGMALQRGEDERRSAILVQHDALALSAAEFGLDRSRAYLGAILDKHGDLDRALDPLLNTHCVNLANFNPDSGVEDDNLPVIDGGVKLAFGGQDRPFLLVPYNADGDDGGTAEGAYLIRFDDNDDDGPGLALSTTTGNNVGAFDCKEGPEFVSLPGLPPTKTNTARDRDRVVMVTVVGIAPGTDVTRAQARKVLRARVGSGPAAGLITGGTIDMQGASHICGAYGNVSVSGDGGFEDGCVCGSSCSKGPPPQSCGGGNVCNIQTASNTCNGQFGNSGGNCMPGSNVPPAPRVEVWSRLNAPPKCTGTSCMPFYYLRELGGKVQVHMWNYAATSGDGGTDGGTTCSDPQGFARIHYPGEPSTGDGGTIGADGGTFSPAEPCWTLVYNGGSGSCPSTQVKMWDNGSLKLDFPNPTAPNPTALIPNNTLVQDVAAGCALAPVVWSFTSAPSVTSSAGCDSPDTLYPEVPGGATRYMRHHRTGGTFTYQPAISSLTPIPRGVWLVDGNVDFKASTPNFPSTLPVLPALPQRPVTVLVTGDVLVDNNTTLSLTPAHREVALMAGRDLELKGGNSNLFTCGNPAALPSVCPSAAIMVHEQFTMGANTHLQGQLVVQNAGKCSNSVSGKAVQSAGNSTISVPAMPPIFSPGSSSVLSWGEGSL